MKKQTALWCLSLLLVMGSLHHILLPENGRRMGKSTRNTKKYRTARIRRYCL